MIGTHQLDINHSSKSFPSLNTLHCETFIFYPVFYALSHLSLDFYFFDATSTLISSSPLCNISQLTELEMDNVPILHNVLASLLSIFTSRLDRRHGLRPVTKIMEVSVSHHLGLDEAALEIRVDGPCCLRCKTPLGYRPAADFFLAGFWCAG